MFKNLLGLLGVTLSILVFVCRYFVLELIILLFLGCVTIAVNTIATVTELDCISRVIKSIRSGLGNGIPERKYDLICPGKPQFNIGGSNAALSVILPFGIIKLRAYMFISRKKKTGVDAPCSARNPPGYRSWGMLSFASKAHKPCKLISKRPPTPHCLK